MNLQLEKISSAQQLAAQLVVAELLRNKIDCFCVSPGARSIPLISALAELAPANQVRLFNDERAAGFWALGYAKATGRPAVLICTSGSATANYFPAIVEAFQSGVPLIVLTADRPFELQASGANQTINQSQIYGSFCKTSIDIPAFENRVFARSLLAQIDNLVSIASGGFPGPVQINIAFRKPFSADESFALSNEDALEIAATFSNEQPQTEYPKIENTLAAPDCEKLRAKLQSARQLLIIAGGQVIPSDRASLLQFAQNIKAPIFADLHSNLRGAGVPRNVFENYNCYLQQIPSANFPDLVLLFGARPVSERLRQFLQLSQAEVICISNYPARQDALENEFLNVKVKLCLGESQACDLLSSGNNAPLDSGLLARCQELELEARQQLTTSLINCENLTEARCVVDLAASFSDCDFYLSPSLLCRELEHFATFAGGNRCLGNRGATGIDGIVASASGFAAAAKRPLLLLLGDQATWHDLTSLGLLAKYNQHFQILIFNNNGGAVFNLLNAPELKTQLLNQHHQTFSAAAKLFNLPYSEIKTEQQWQGWLQASSANSFEQSGIVELFFDGEQSADFFRNFKLS